MQIDDMIRNEFNAHLSAFSKNEALFTQLKKACDMVVNTLKSGGRVFICGNGGSAADAQHFAAELTGRYKSERAGLAGIALSTDTSALTAIGNDYGFELVFARQLQGLGRAGDLLVAISTSGNSQNILKAIEVAKSADIAVLGLSGKGGGKMSLACDLNLVVASDDTARIQESHIFFIHTICQAVDMEFSA